MKTRLLRYALTALIVALPLVPIGANPAAAAQRCGEISKIVDGLGIKTRACINYDGNNVIPNSFGWAPYGVAWCGVYTQIYRNGVLWHQYFHYCEPQPPEDVVRFYRSSGPGLYEMSAHTVVRAHNKEFIVSASTSWRI